MSKMSSPESLGNDESKKPNTSRRHCVVFASSRTHSPTYTVITMSKFVTEAGTIREENKFGPNKLNYLVVTDDKTTYHFQKFEDEPIWNLKGRWEGGDYKTHKGRLPKYVTLHMEGFALQNDTQFAR